MTWSELGAFVPFPGRRLRSLRSRLLLRSSSHLLAEPRAPLEVAGYRAIAWGVSEDRG